jgi:hypothetical protein
MAMRMRKKQPFVEGQEIKEDRRKPKNQMQEDSDALPLHLQSLQEIARNSPQVQLSTQLQKIAHHPFQKPNHSGLPDPLKSGIESLSGYSMDDVRVHYNSDRPAQLKAHAFAQGTEIHLAAGQEEHLPHEAWHVVQQKQGRVKPTLQLQGGVKINDDRGLETEADRMGEKSLQATLGEHSLQDAPLTTPILQRKLFTQKGDEKATPATTEELVAKLENAELSEQEKARLATFAEDDLHHIFHLNSSDKITRRELLSVLNPWPEEVKAHPITQSKLALEILGIKKELKQGAKEEVEWLGLEEIRKQSAEAMQAIKKLSTTDDVRDRIRVGYAALFQHISARYKGKVNSQIATYLEEWALTTEYLRQGIPVWESNPQSTLQQRVDLAPHKLYSKPHEELPAHKILSDLAPGFYSFVVPLTFPFKRKIMIAPEVNVQASITPTRSEGHSALSTKDGRKNTKVGTTTLVKGVLFAGVVTIGEGGQVVKWTNDSGHYRVSKKEADKPDDQAGVLTLKELEVMGFPFPSDKYEDYKST